MRTGARRLQNGTRMHSSMRCIPRHQLHRTATAQAARVAAQIQCAELAIMTDYLHRSNALDYPVMVVWQRTV